MNCATNFPNTAIDLLSAPHYKAGIAENSAHRGMLFGEKLDTEDQLNFFLRQDKSEFSQADMTLSHLSLSLICDDGNGSATQRISSEDWVPPQSTIEESNEGFEVIHQGGHGNGHAEDWMPQTSVEESSEGFEVTPGTVEWLRLDPTGDTKKSYEQRQDQNILGCSLDLTNFEWTKPDVFATERGISDLEHAAYTDNDVLLGRGGGTNKQLGNKRFREEIEALQPLYETQKKHRKTEIRNFIADMNDIKGRRFMVREKGCWTEAAPATKLKKISQHFRDTK